MADEQGGAGGEMGAFESAMAGGQSSGLSPEVASAAAALEATNPAPVDETAAFFDEAPETEPAAEPEPVAPTVAPLDDNQKAWAKWAGIPDQVAALGWDVISPLVLRQHQAYEQQQAAAQAKTNLAPGPSSQPEQQKQPDPWAEAFKWSDDNLVDPELNRFAGHLDQKISKSMQHVLTRIEQLAEQVKPVQTLVQETQQAKLDAQVRAFSGAVEKLDPEFFGTEANPNHQRRGDVWKAAQGFLQMGLASDNQKAIKMAYHALAGEHVAKKEVQAISAKAQARKGQVSAQPSTRGEKPIPLGPQRAALFVQEFLQKSGANAAPLDPDALGAL